MGKWVKGQSGNPRGKIPTPPELKDACRRLSLPAVQFLGAVVRSKKERTQDRIRAAEVLLERGYGKAAQAVEVSGPGGGPVESTVRTEVASDEQLADILARMAAAGALPGAGGPGPVAAGADATVDAVHAAAADDAAVGVPAPPAA